MDSSQRKHRGLIVRSALPALLVIGGLSYGLLRQESGAGEMAAQFYVSPTGTAGGDGSLGRPWNLQTALSKMTVVKPGDTIWLRGGTYSGTFTSTLNGAPGKLITLRAYPAERVILTDINFRKPKKDTLNVQGTYTAFWGFEVTTYGKDKAPGECWDNDRAGDAVSDCIQNSVRIDGAHNKFINLTVHDTNNAFGGSKFAVDTEYYGNVIYNVGRNRHEHGIYPQNNDPRQPKNIIDNVFFNISGDAIHMYGLNGTLDGFNVEGNTFFSSGAPSRKDGQQDAFIRVGGSLPASAISIADNCFYSSPALSLSIGLELGYSNTNNDDVVFRDNYVASGLPLWVRTPWRSMTVTGNTFYSYKTTNVAFGFRNEKIRNVISKWDNNRYIYSPAQKFQFTSISSAAEGGRMSYGDWKDRMGQDAHSTAGSRELLEAEPPTILVRPNRYEPGRGFITAYNWSKKPIIDADISGLGLRRGQKFVVRDVQNLFGNPLFTGTYNGEPLALSMMSTTITPPEAQAPGTLLVAHTSPEFGVFLVEPSANTPPVKGGTRPKLQIF